MSRRKIKVLIVDDSPVFREALARGLSADPEIEIAAKAIDPFDARDKILQYQPDVMTCDIQMPKMNGIEFIRMLLPQYPLPVIVVSTVSEAVFDAMNAGAVDFVTKPDASAVNEGERVIRELTHKIKIAARSKIIGRPAARPLENGRPDPERSSTAASAAPAALARNLPHHLPVESERPGSGRIIAIGASTGGTEAISSILTTLPETAPGILIVQHIPPVFSKMFAERLNKTTRLNVKEAETGDYLEPGKVLIAPGDRHMQVRKVGSRYRVECFEGEKVNGHSPSVDVLFDSVAAAAGPEAIGVILTGMGYDGAKGLLAMRRKGARTIGQDEKSSVVYGMPKAAYDIKAVEKQVSLEAIPATIISMLSRR